LFCFVLFIHIVLNVASTKFSDNTGTLACPVIFLGLNNQTLLSTICPANEVLSEAFKILIFIYFFLFIREELMHGLKKAGVISLESLEETHLLQLIDLLISEKKWIQENTSGTFPFTLSIPSASTPSATNQKKNASKHD
jgi:OST-HTH Associated domain